MLHKQSFEHGDFDAAAMEGEQSVGLHGIEGMTDVESAVVEFGGNLVHQNVERLGTGRVETA